MFAAVASEVAHLVSRYEKALPRGKQKILVSFVEFSLISYG